MAFDFATFGGTTAPPKSGVTPDATKPGGFDFASFGEVTAPVKKSNIPGADLPMSPFGQRTREIATAAGEAGVAKIQKTAQEFAAAPAIEKPLVALKAPMQAVGAGARVLFAPLSAAIESAIENLSDLPIAQRIAMSDKVGRFLDVTNDFGGKVGDIAKTNPELAGDVQDFVDTITLAIGPKGAKIAAQPVIGAAEKVSTKIKSVIPTRAVSVVEKEADDILGASVRSTAPDVAETFKKYGIEAPVSAVTTNRAVQGAEAMAQSSWFGGGAVTKIVEEAQAGMSKVAESLRKYADPQTLIKPGVTLENVGTELKGALTTATKTFNEAKTKLYDEAGSRIGAQQAILEETRKALDDIIQRKLASSDPTARNTARYYQSLRNNLSTADKRTFVNVKQTRTDIGSKLKNFTDPITTGDSATLKRIYAAISKDLDATVSASGVEASNALKAANEFYKAGINKINSIMGRTIKNARSPERIFGSLIKAGDATAIRELKELVGAEAFQSVGDAFMNTVIQSAIVPLTGKMNPGKLAAMLTKYGDDTIRELVGERGLQQIKDLLRGSIADDIIERATLDGRVQPGRLAQAIEAYDDKILQRVFSPEELQKLKDLKDMAQAMGRGTKIVAGSPTAEKLQLGINLVLGVTNLPIALAKVGIEYGITKLFTTPWGKKLLTGGKLGKGVKTGTGVAETAIKAPEVVPVAKSSPEAGKGTKQGDQAAFASAVDVPVEMSTPKTMDNLYHATTPDRLESIVKNGITSGNKTSIAGEGVSGVKNISLAGSEKQAAYYVEKNRVILRTKSEFDPTLEHDTLGGAGNFITKENVPPNMLEIKTKDGWQSLTDFYDKATGKKQEGIYRYSEKPTAPVTRESTKKKPRTVPKR